MGGLGLGPSTVAFSFSHNMSKNQCCGSMTFWGGSGSGSADPCLSLMDPDPDSNPDPDPDAIPDPAIFVMNLQDANKKIIFKKSFFVITF